MPGGQHRLARPGIRGGLRLVDGQRLPYPRPAAEARPVPGGRRPRRAGPRCTSISSAMRPSTCRSDSTPGTPNTAPNVPGRPSQFTNVPAFSTTAATGSTTSARSVTALARSLQADDERRGVDRLERGGRVGQVARVHPGDDQGVQVPAGRGGQDLPGVAAQARPAAQRTPQARATSARAVAVPRRAGRAEAGRAGPRRRSPRVPRRGAAPRPGWHRSRAARRGHRGQRARAPRPVARPPG